MGHIPLNDEEADFVEGVGIDAAWLDNHAATSVVQTRLRRVCWVSGAVIGICLIVTGVSVYKTDKFHALLHHERLELAKAEIRRDILAEQLKPVGLEALLVGVLAQVNPGRLDERGRNHIAVAMRKGDIGLAEYWEGRGVSWNQPVWYGRQVDGKWTQVFDTEGEPQVGVSPIMIAARRGHYQVIRYMLNPVRRDKIDWGFSCYGGQTLADILNEIIILNPDNKQLPAILSEVERVIKISGGVR